MLIAVTGATGFIGRYILRALVAEGHRCRCLRRATSDISGLDDVQPAVDWVVGNLADTASLAELVAGTDGVIHAALDRPGAGFRGAEGSIPQFAQCNIVGTLQLIEAAREAGCQRFVFISTCAVHEKIRTDRPLDEAHPAWPLTHYGAHKAALEKFVHSYGWGAGFPICALRPTGVYGLAQPPSSSKWFDLVQRVVRGETVNCRKGGKEVHAADVARAALLLLRADADQMRGEAFNCYDRYVSLHEVAEIAREIAGTQPDILGERTAPQNQIVTEKLRALGMQFGGTELLRSTIAELVAAAQNTQT